LIFVTIGSQMPFDRLIIAVDEWAKDSGYEVFAQVGQTQYIPQHIDWCNNLTPEQFLKKIRDASAVVSHAGMGTIITALELGKPIMIMPRRGDLRETRNDHQIATVKYFTTFDRVEVVMDEKELVNGFKSLLSSSSLLKDHTPIGSYANDFLISTIRNYIN